MLSYGERNENDKRNEGEGGTTENGKDQSKKCASKCCWKLKIEGKMWEDTSIIYWRTGV